MAYYGANRKLLQIVVSKLHHKKIETFITSASTSLLLLDDFMSDIIN